MVTGKLVEQQLHGADVQVQLVHVVLAEVTDLQVPDGEESFRGEPELEVEQQVGSPGPLTCEPV